MGAVNCVNTCDQGVFMNLAAEPIATAGPRLATITMWLGDSGDDHGRLRSHLHRGRQWADHLDPGPLGTRPRPGHDQHPLGVATLIACSYPPDSRELRSTRAGGSFQGVTRGTPDIQAPADAPRREITRRKWLMRSIRYPVGARFLRVSRILRVNPAGWAAGGAAGSGGAGWVRAGVAGEGSGLDRRLGDQASAGGGRGP